MLFREAVSAIDAGDVTGLERQLTVHPNLARYRLDSPGAWLRDQVGDALDGFLRGLTCCGSWRRTRCATASCRVILHRFLKKLSTSRSGEKTDTQQEQLDYALRLVCWSWIARECGVSIALVDVLVDAGASVDGRNAYGGRYGTHSDSAIYNSNFAAAERLLERGAAVTLSTALCLERWADVDCLARTATLDEKQDAFVQAAMSGKAEALCRMLALGTNPTTVSAMNQSHATALHHAVCSGTLDAVRVLVDAGADFNRRDTIYDATPLGWAKYCGQQETDASSAKPYAEIAAYLSEKGAKD